MEGYDYVQTQKNNTVSTDKRGVRPLIQETENSGISIWAIKEMFEQVKILESSSTKWVTLSVDFIQIYNEKVFDLLNFGSIANKKSKGLKMWWDKES